MKGRTCPKEVMFSHSIVKTFHGFLRKKCCKSSRIFSSPMSQIIFNSKESLSHPTDAWVPRFQHIETSAGVIRAQMAHFCWGPAPSSAGHWSWSSSGGPSVSPQASGCPCMTHTDKVVTMDGNICKLNCRIKVAAVQINLSLSLFFCLSMTDLGFLEVKKHKVMIYWGGVAPTALKWSKSFVVSINRKQQRREK